MHTSTAAWAVPCVLQVWRGCVFGVTSALALVLLGCASFESAQPFAQPTAAQLQGLVSAEFAATPLFSDFDQSYDQGARSLAASFQPVLTAVYNRGCRPAGAAHVDCTIELVMRFPGLDDRESRVTWDRRYALAANGWQLAGSAY